MPVLCRRGGVPSGESAPGPALDARTRVVGPRPGRTGAPGELLLSASDWTGEVRLEREAMLAGLVDRGRASRDVWLVMVEDGPGAVVTPVGTVRARAARVGR